MFRNIGRTIKGFAILLCVLGMFSSLYIGVNSYANWKNESGYGTKQYQNKHRADEMEAEHDSAVTKSVIIVICGAIASYLSTMFIYGFGELIDNSKKTCEKIDSLIIEVRHQSDALKESLVRPTEEIVADIEPSQ